MLSWDNRNLNSGPLIIHLNDVDDIDATLDIVSQSTHIPSSNRSDVAGGVFT